MKRPFDSANTRQAKTGDRRTWRQRVIANHTTHPEWGTQQHIAALTEAVPEIAVIADLNGTTVHAMVTQALEEASWTRESR